MLKKFGTATLAAAALLLSAAPSHAATVTVPLNSIADFKNPGFPGGFQYTGGFTTAGGISTLNAGSKAQAGLSPVITAVPTQALLSFDYSVASGGLLDVFLGSFDSSKNLISSTQIFTGLTGTSSITNSDFTSLLAANQSFSLEFINSGTAGAGFSPVTLNVTPVPEPVEAPAFCMLLVAGGALVLRLRNKSVTAEEADLN
jgi:hypothetical protein